MKTRARSLIDALAKRFGGTLVSALEYRTIHHQRLELLKEAANLYRPTLAKSGATGIVFSFNRPVQLHATLESYFRHAKNPAPLIVQYRSTLPESTDVYNQLKALYKKQPVTWVEETTCRQTLLTILNGLKTPKLFFLVDDDVFINPIDMKAFCAINPLEYVPSMRLHPGLTYSYTMKLPQKPPKTLAPSTEVPGMLTWHWGDETIEWDYPYSVEGHLFDTAEILMMTRASPFKAPNTYEGVLHGFTPYARARPGLCFARPALFNNPCNKVQTENANHAGESINMSPEFFLRKWQEGYQIDTAALSGAVLVSAHQEVAFSFTPRA